MRDECWGGWDPRLAEVTARADAGIVCSHAGGQRPRTRPFRVATETNDRGQLGDELATIVTVRARDRAEREGSDRAGSVVGGFQGAAELRGPAPGLDHPALGSVLEPAGPA
jgi:dihydropteroate synthase